MAPQTVINKAFYKNLPPDRARYQLEHLGDSKFGGSLAGYIIAVFIGVLAIILRFLSRGIGRIEYGADDWTMLAVLVFIISY